MRRSSFLLATAVLGILGMQPSARADLAYNVVQYTDSDFSISGTITTNGTVGNFATAPFNFTSWSIRFTYSGPRFPNHSVSYP